MKTIYKLIIASLLILQPLVGHAADKAASAAKAETASTPYVTTDDGKVEFRAVGRPAMLKIVGQGKSPTGELSVDDKGALAGKVTFALDSLDTGINMRNEHMKTKYLEVGKYPTAELTLDPIALPELAAAGDFKKEKVPFTGKLKLHGEEKPVSGTADITRAGTTLKVAADYSIKTGDFKIDTPKYMGITVAEDVGLAVSLSAKRRE